MEQELKKKFTGIGEVKGFEFEQLRKSPTAFLYQVTQNGKQHYEVFKKKLTGKVLDWNTKEKSDTEFVIIYPKSASFGVWAWCFSSLKKAIIKFEALQ